MMMNDMSTHLFIINGTLLVLHEIESAYENEWKILKLPVGITGFLVIHIPLLLGLFYGAILLDNGSEEGKLIGFAAGLGGAVPLLVHKVFFKNKMHFNRTISDILIYLNAAVGLALSALIIR